MNKITRKAARALEKHKGNRENFEGRPIKKAQIGNSHTSKMGNRAINFVFEVERRDGSIRTTLVLTLDSCHAILCRDSLTLTRPDVMWTKRPRVPVVDHV
jgi:hypothetical protein